MKIGAVSLGWSGTPLQVVFKKIAAMGGECVDINGHTLKHHQLEISPSTAPQIKKWAAESGLEIGSLAGYSDFAQTDKSNLAAEIERLLTTCQAASEIQVPLVRAFAGDVKPGVLLDDVLPFMIESFQEAAAKALTLGISLGIENHGRLINDGPQLAQLIDQVAAPNLGVTLDTGNFAWAGHNLAQVHSDYESLLPHILCLHIKDGIWHEDGFVFVPAGEGDLPLFWLLETLIDRGYAGMVYSEFEGKGDFETGTAVSIKHLKEMVDEIERQRKESANET
ncbi:MAG: sugar phosphate isomerase/epimerase [Anaerolineae bacterium]|nr:sugar phosphate isomerase/epimerase [Anaerolineae bacterium]